MAIHRLDKKNIERRFGTHCTECGKKLGRYRLDGVIDGKSVAFCSFGCQDSYSDKADAAKAVEGK